MEKYTCSVLDIVTRISIFLFLHFLYRDRRTIQMVHVQRNEDRGTKVFDYQMQRPALKSNRETMKIMMWRYYDFFSYLILSCKVFLLVVIKRTSYCFFIIHTKSCATCTAREKVFVCNVWIRCSFAKFCKIKAPIFFFFAVLNSRHNVIEKVLELSVSWDVTNWNNSSFFYKSIICGSILLAV